MKLKQPITGIKYSRNNPFNEILRIFGPKLSNATKFWPQDVVKLSPVGVLLFGLTLYESHVIWTAAPRGNEIRASEENLWFFVVWTLTNLNISWNFRKFTFFKNHVVQVNSLQNEDRDARPGPKWSSNNPLLGSNTPGTIRLMKSWEFSVQSCRTPPNSDRKTWSSCPLSAYYSSG